MGFFLDLITPTSYKIPQAPTVDITGEQTANAQANLASFSAAKDLANQYNDFMAQSVEKRLKSSMPYLAGLESQAADVYSKQLRGELSLSDQAASQRRSAARGLGLGISGSPAGSALTLRDLGLTQYGVQQGAQASMPGFAATMAGIHKAPMFDFSNVFMSPQERISAQFRNKENTWNVQNLKNQMAAQPEPWMRALAGQGDALQDFIAGTGSTGLGAWAAGAGTKAAAGGGY